MRVTITRACARPLIRKQRQVAERENVLPLRALALCKYRRHARGARASTVHHQAHTLQRRARADHIIHQQHAPAGNQLAVLQACHDGCGEL